MLVTNKEKKLKPGIIPRNTAKSTILSLDLEKTMLELFVMSREEHESIDKLAKVLRTLTS